MAQKHQGCVQAAKGPIAPEHSGAKEKTRTEEGVKTMSVRVGMPAPDFEANAYMDGEFKTLKLSDYKGKWVTLCFYPGDFTFV